MWSLKILNGPLAGRVFKLKEGENLVGRTPGCDIVLESNGISKKHCKIIVSGKSLSVVDLQSSNGTFVNGVRVQSRILNPMHDKLAFYDLLVLFESQAMQQQLPGGPGSMNPSAAQPVWQNSNLAMQSEPAPNEKPEKNAVEAAQSYIDEVAMPGVYRLLELFEMKQVIGGFILMFVLLVTLLSVVPLVRITKSSIETESIRRARGVARMLAAANTSFLQQGLDSALTTRAAEYEEGVQIALLISAKDGSILAPVSRGGAYANEPFIHKARKQNREVVETIGSDMIGASVPIETYNAETGGRTPIAYAMVLYNMGSLAIDDGRTISLFVQTLFIALVLGSILFFFLYKLVEQPLVAVNQQLDYALKNDGKNVTNSYLVPSLEKLVANINTALNRVGFGGAKEAPRNTSENRKLEACNIAQISSSPVIVLDKDRLISFVNQPLEDLMGMRLASVQEQSLEILIDDALRQSLQDLVDRATAQPGLIASNQLDMAGKNYDIDAQAIMGAQSPDFFYISFRKKEDEFA
ncbi:MAG: FHA domain-containing protein [Bdellovibrionia bacterium]